MPLTLSLLEVILNWRGYYYGSEFNRLAYYQIAAKVHEIAIQASLAVMVLSYIRREIALGKGIPFGIFLGGIHFVQPSYLWSTELWSLVTAKGVEFKKKASLLVLLLVSGIVATTAGPSSATLLVPRQISWPLPPSYFTVNGSFQDIWPDRMEGSMVPDDCKILLSNNETSLCPGGNWWGLWQTFPTESDYNDLDRDSSILQFDNIPDLVWPISKAVTSQLCGSSARNQACSSSPHDILIAGAWNSTVSHPELYDFPRSSTDETHSLNNGYHQPYVAAACVFDLITDKNMGEPLRFPRISETEFEYSNDNAIVSVSQYNKSMINEAPGNKSEYRLE